MKSIFLPTSENTRLATVYDSSITAFRQHNSDRGIIWSDCPENADCIVLFEEWKTRFWDFGVELQLDPFFVKHWKKIVTVNCDDLGRGFVPGCYTCLNMRNFDRRLHRACAYPYSYNLLAEDSGAAAVGRQTEPRWLFSFRGNASNLSLRRAIFGLLSRDPEGNLVDVRTQFHMHSADERRLYVDDILASRFVLCPRGQGPSSYRLFEVMALGRCPVIISDQWVPIDGVDWPSCAIFVKERDIATIPKLLRSEASRALELGRNAKAAWMTHFSERAKFRAMFESLVEIHEGLQRNFFDYRTRWRSWRFYRSNGWLLHQRVAARLRRSIDTLRIARGT